MESRKLWATAAGLALLTGGVAVASFAGSADAEELKIGTLAPKQSIWGQVFQVWETAVDKKTDGKLKLNFFYNGQQGDEAAMVGKMKAGQLGGAAVTAVGLSKIYKPIVALQMPGLFSTWAKLDQARDAMKGDFEKGVSDAGYTLVGWFDVGAVHLMSKGFAVRSPDDVKGKKPVMWRDDVLQPVIFQAIGGVTPVPLNIPEVLPQLNTGAVNIVSGGALWSEQLQWTSRLDTINDDVTSLTIGGVVLSTKALDALPEDLRAIVIDTGKVAAAALKSRIRKEDDAAYKRLKGKMTVVTLSADEKAAWASLYKDVRKRLSQGTFAPDLVTKLEGFAK